MPDALYRCRKCGHSYVLRVMAVLKTITLGTLVAPGGMAHGCGRKCKGRMFDLVGEAEEVS